jgi:pseudouridine-5'-phosphate glycosidase
VCELTGGNSLAANIQLVLNNAALGARIASLPPPVKHLWGRSL